MKRKKSKISKTRNKKGEIATNTKEIQWIMRLLWENAFQENGKSWRNGQISRYYDHPKLNQEDINHLNRSVTCNEIEAAIKNLPIKKIPGTDTFSAEFYLAFR
jgi:hypothetical protein